MRYLTIATLTSFDFKEILMDFPAYQWIARRMHVKAAVIRGTGPASVGTAGLGDALHFRTRPKTR